MSQAMSTSNQENSFNGAAGEGSYLDPNVTTKSTTTTHSIHSESGQTHHQHRVHQERTSPTATRLNAGSGGIGGGDGDLKILSQLRNIEQINEQRRVFLETTIRDVHGDGKYEQVHGIREHRERRELANGNQSNLESSVTETQSSRISTKKYAAGAPLKSPVSPPPKPPMLSRTRSLGPGDTPPNTPTTTATNDNNVRPVSLQPQLQTPTSPIITSDTVKTLMAPQPEEAVATVSIHEEEDDAKAVGEEKPTMRKPARPMSLAPEKPERTDLPKPISANHYERLIEELKCPGCAQPMRAPSLLCQTGHSVCGQCTRILLLCPLCKEPFTTMRSLTIEALCSKAHFRCTNASGGCMVRLQLDLLGWHERRCIYKPMRCFMGRVWGDCNWQGREAFWKDHLEEAHANKVFTINSMDLIWNMSVKQRPLTGYYVFEVFDEMFNFYEVYDKERVLFTMTCTSSMREKKHNYAFEVTMVHEDNEALAITQKYPVHSEYDKDILLDGTCVSISLSDLAKFIDDDKLLHYRVRILQVKSPRKSKALRQSNGENGGMHPIDFQQTQIEGVNLKNVPPGVILTRKLDDIPYADNATTPTSAAGSSEDELAKVRRRYAGKPRSGDGDSESDPEFEAYIAKKWGTPQMNFNRKYLKNVSSESSSGSDDVTSRNGKPKHSLADDKISVSSTSMKKRMSNTLRKSFRTLKSIEVKPFLKRSPEKHIEHD